MQESIYI